MKYVLIITWCLAGAISCKNRSNEYDILYHEIYDNIVSKRTYKNETTTSTLDLYKHAEALICSKDDTLFYKYLLEASKEVDPGATRVYFDDGNMHTLKLMFSLLAKKIYVENKPQAYLKNLKNMMEQASLSQETDKMTRLFQIEMGYIFISCANKLNYAPYNSQEYSKKLIEWKKRINSSLPWRKSEGGNVQDFVGKAVK